MVPASTSPQTSPDSQKRDDLWTPSRGNNLWTPKEETISGLPEEGTIFGLPEEGTISGLPEEGTISGLPEEGTISGLPEEGTIFGLPEEGTTSGLPEGGTPSFAFVATPRCFVEGRDRLGCILLSTRPQNCRHARAGVDGFRDRQPVSALCQRVDSQMRASSFLCVSIMGGGGGITSVFMLAVLTRV